VRCETSRQPSSSDLLLVSLLTIGCAISSLPSPVLQLFLSSPKAILKFAAIKTLSKLAQTHPTAVAACNLDMENLITDSNRSIATYAITTLLKASLAIQNMGLY
jgi:hypothetical protein